MATTHTLPTFVNHLGTFTVSVTTDVAGLTTPTENTIRDLRGGNESLELIPGVLNKSPMSITVIDTADSFWAQAIVDSCFIMVTLDEGSGSTFAFAGDVDLQAASGDEAFNDGTNTLRMITVTLKNPLERLKNSAAGAFDSSAEIQAATPALGWFAPILSLFSAAIETIFSQSYQLNDAYVQAGSGTYDFQFNDGASDLDFDEIYFKTQDAVGYIGYLDNTDPVYWSDNYENGYEFIKTLALNFGLIPRYDYDPSTGRHRMQLLQRGRCFGLSVGLLAPKSSGFSFSSYMILNKVYVLWPTDTAEGWYWNFGPVTAAPAPSWFEPELEITCIFVAGYDLTTYPTVDYQRIWSMATGDPVQIDTVKCWNYSPSTYFPIDSGEDAWNEYVDADVTATADTGTKVDGSSSCKLSVGAGVSAGDILATEAVGALDISTASHLEFWVLTSVSLASGSLQILLDEDAACASPSETIDIPATTAGAWKKVTLALSSAAGDRDAIASVGLKMVSDVGAFDVYIDAIQAFVGLETFSSGDARLEKALVTYYVNRYPGSGQVTYNRTFPLMKAESGSHVAVQPMSMVDIGGVTYHAIECDKDWTTGEVSLVLQKL